MRISAGETLAEAMTELGERITATRAYAEPFGFSVAITDAVNLTRALIGHARLLSVGSTGPLIDGILTSLPVELSWDLVVLYDGERPPDRRKWTVYRPDGSAVVFPAS